MYSILAGCAIALGSFINLYVGGGIVGAVLFSIGLILVCSFDWELCTGRVGTIGINKRTIKMLVGNLYGAMCVGLIIAVCPIGAAVSVAASRVIATRTALQCLLLSIGTGVLIEAAVSMYRKTGDWKVVILPVAAFVITGMPHCIADAFMYTVANAPLGVAVRHLSCSIVGNSFGALIMNYYGKRKS